LGAAEQCHEKQTEHASGARRAKEDVMPNTGKELGRPASSDARAGTTAPPLVPIHHGSPRFHEVDVAPFRVTEVQFGAKTWIEPHHHDRPNIGVMLNGSFDLAFRSRSFACEPGTVFFEPAGETHCNCMGCQGAWVLAVQPNPDAPELEGTLDLLLHEPAEFHHPHAVHLGRRIARECRAHDEFSHLMIQGLSLELLGALGRASALQRHARAPGWLRRIEEMLCHGEPRTIRVTELAREAGVHAAHLAREFRKRSGRSLGGFLLQRRLEWAARQLGDTERPIAEIALQAGFSDQSHFTRRFREYAGATPRRFRAARRPESRAEVNGS